MYGSSLGDFSVVSPGLNEADDYKVCRPYFT